VGQSVDLVFTSRSDMRDASSLIIHYLSFLPSGQTDESFRISQFLHDTLPQFIDVPAMSESAARHRQGVSMEHVSGLITIIVVMMVMIII